MTAIYDHVGYAKFICYRMELETGDTYLIQFTASPWSNHLYSPVYMVDVKNNTRKKLR